MTFKVYRTHEFQTNFDKLTKKQQEQISKIEGSLTRNPFSEKPLGVNFFREKKVEEKRVYYLIYQDIILVLMVAISSKKIQQTTIDSIRKELDEYKNLAKIISRNTT